METNFKKILTVFLIVVIGLGAAVGGWVLYKNLTGRAATADRVAITRINPDAKSLQIGDTVAAKIELDTAGQNVSSVKLKVNYDATAFSATVDYTGSKFNAPVSQSPSGGVAQITAGANPYVKDDNALVATLNLKAIKNTDPSGNNVTFSSDSEVFKPGSAAGSKIDIFKAGYGAKYKVSSTGTEAGKAKLILSPATANHKVNESFSAKILVNTGGEKVSSVAAYINFSDEYFDATLDGTGSDFGNFSPGTEIKNGLVTINAGASTPKTGNDLLVATLKLKGVKETLATTGTNSVYDSGSFVFNQNSSKVYKYVQGGQPINILDSVTNGQYNITSTGSGESSPLPPINLKGKAGNTIIDWSWSHNPAGVSSEKGYKIYVGTKSGQYTATTTVKEAESVAVDVKDALKYRSTSLTNGKTYYAVVRTYNSNGHLSAPSNEAKATPSGDGTENPTEPSTGGIFEMPTSLVATGIIIGTAILVALGVSILIWVVARKRKKNAK